MDGPRLTLPNFAKLTPKLVSKTPLITPDLGKCYEDPWIYQRTDAFTDIKITAITPLGNIAPVPTSDKGHASHNGVTSKKQIPNKNVVNVSEEVTEPSKIAPIYLDNSDRDYDFVSKKMHSISIRTMSLQKQYCTKLKDMPDVYGRVSVKVFDELLSVYENNQVYYQDRLDDETMSIEDIKTNLTKLEWWFSRIIEPKENEGRRERETNKTTKRITSFCDPELHKYIQLLPDNFVCYIMSHL